MVSALCKILTCVDAARRQGFVVLELPVSAGPRYRSERRSPSSSVGRFRSLSRPLCKARTDGLQTIDAESIFAASRRSPRVAYRERNVQSKKHQGPPRSKTTRGLACRWRRWHHPRDARDGTDFTDGMARNLRVPAPLVSLASVEALPAPIGPVARLPPARRPTQAFLSVFPCRPSPHHALPCPWLGLYWSPPCKNDGWCMASLPPAVRPTLAVPPSGTTESSAPANPLL
jgi:hypothetical protein